LQCSLFLPRHNVPARRTSKGREKDAERSGSVSGVLVLGEGEGDRERESASGAPEPKGKRTKQTNNHNEKQQTNETTNQ
jgi:hypothetical protein